MKKIWPFFIFILTTAQQASAAPTEQEIRNFINEAGRPGGSHYEFQKESAEMEAALSAGGIPLDSPLRFGNPSGAMPMGGLASPYPTVEDYFKAESDQIKDYGTQACNFNFPGNLNYFHSYDDLHDSYNPFSDTRIRVRGNRVYVHFKYNPEDTGQPSGLCEIHIHYTFVTIVLQWDMIEGDYPIRKISTSSEIFQSRHLKREDAIDRTDLSPSAIYDCATADPQHITRRKPVCRLVNHLTRAYNWEKDSSVSFDGDQHRKVPQELLAVWSSPAMAKVMESSTQEDLASRSEDELRRQLLLAETPALVDRLGRNGMPPTDPSKLPRGLMAGFPLLNPQTNSPDPRYLLNLSLWTKGGGGRRFTRVWPLQDLIDEIDWPFVMKKNSVHTVIGDYDWRLNKWLPDAGRVNPAVAADRLNQPERCFRNNIANGRVPAAYSVITTNPISNQRIDWSAMKSNDSPKDLKDWRCIQNVGPIQSTHDTLPTPSDATLQGILSGLQRSLRQGGDQYNYKPKHDSIGFPPFNLGNIRAIEPWANQSWTLDMTKYNSPNVAGGMCSRVINEGFYDWPDKKNHFPKEPKDFHYVNQRTPSFYERNDAKETVAVSNFHFKGCWMWPGVLSYIPWPKIPLGPSQYYLWEIRTGDPLERDTL